MTDIVYVVSAECGDYYCGCGIGHLLGVAYTPRDAERLRQEGEAAIHRYGSHGETGRPHQSFYGVTVTEIPAGVLQHEAMR